MNTDDVTGVIVDEAMRIHRELGPGLFESTYEAVLAKALVERGLAVERQKAIALSYCDLFIAEAYRADMLVAGHVIVEVKAIEKFGPLHTKQLLTYLRLSGLQVGLLLNFNEYRMKDGVKRVVDNYRPQRSRSAATTEHSFPPRPLRETRLERGHAPTASAPPPAPHAPWTAS